MMRKEAGDMPLEYSCARCPHVGEYILDFNRGSRNQAVFVCPMCNYKAWAWTR